MVKHSLAFDFADWKLEAERILTKEYCLTFELAGLYDEDIERYYNHNESPQSFVKWFAEKYDLIDFKIK